MTEKKKEDAKPLSLNGNEADTMDGRDGSSENEIREVDGLFSNSEHPYDRQLARDADGRDMEYRYPEDLRDLRDRRDAYITRRDQLDHLDHLNRQYDDLNGQLASNCKYLYSDEEYEYYSTRSRQYEGACGDWQYYNDFSMRDIRDRTECINEDGFWRDGNCYSRRSFDSDFNDQRDSMKERIMRDMKNHGNIVRVRKGDLARDDRYSHARFRR